MNGEGRLVLVVPRFPVLSETFIATKALGLVARGWDVQVGCGTSAPAKWTAFGAELHVGTLRSRVHRAPDLSPGPSLPPLNTQATTAALGGCVC